MNQQNLADFIWNVADVLRGDFKQSIYGRIILPFTLLRRLECVLEPTRDKVRSQYESMKASGVDMDLILPTTAGATFYNVSQFSLGSVGSTSTRANLEDYVAKFSANARQVFEHFAFSDWLVQLDKANLLYLVTQKFASIDLHPETISNHEMGLVFEHLIRKFAESANDTAGEFFTPRDVVRLATTLVFAPDHQALNGEGVVRTVYDCAAGTGGFLSSAIEQVAEWNPKARLVPYAQELNPETYAISVADKLIQGFETRNIKLGNTLSNDQLPHEQFDYCLANPPFGVKWEKVQKQVQDEHSQQGYAGRFGPPACRGWAMARCCSLCTCCPSANPLSWAAAASASCCPARRCSMAAPAPASRRSAAGFWKTTGWRRSSRCPPTFSTTPASAPTSGCCPTTRTRCAKARCS